MSDLAQALMIAIRVHAGQVDKQGEPYLLHVLRVVEAVPGEREKVVAALHDVGEDGGAEGRLLAHMLDLDPEQRQAFALLTRGDSEVYADYIASLAEAEGIGGEIAREVKLADLRDNLGRIPTAKNGEGYTHGSWASLRARYEKAIAVLEPALVADGLAGRETA